MVLAADHLGELIHDLLYNIGGSLVVMVGRLADLEENVRVLRRTADERMIRRHAASAMLANQVVVDHRSQNFVGRAVRFC